MPTPIRPGRASSSRMCPQLLPAPTRPASSRSISDHAAWSRPPTLALPDPCTIVVRVQPWLLDGRPQTVLAIESGPALSVGAEGARLEMGDSRVQVATPMLKGRWYELRVIAADGRVRLRQTALQHSWGIADSGEAEGRGTFGALAAILAGVHDRAKPIEPDKAKCLAWWDFSAEISTDRIIDRGPQGLHGHVRNLPMRAVRGSRWTGEETNWRHMPRHYAAIHFHQDDSSSKLSA